MVVFYTNPVHEKLNHAVVLSYKDIVYFKNYYIIVLLDKDTFILAIEEFRHLLHLGQFSACVLIITQVFLVSYQDDGNIGTEMFDLWGPLLWDVFCGEKKKQINKNSHIYTYI